MRKNDAIHFVGFLIRGSLYKNLPDESHPSSLPLYEKQPQKWGIDYIKM